MKLGAKFSLEVVGEVHLFVQFVLPVGKGTLVLELALAIEVPVLAHLSLILQLVALHEVVSLHLRLEELLWLLDRGIDVLTRILLFYLVSVPLKPVVIRTLVIRRLFCQLLIR